MKKIYILLIGLAIFMGGCSSVSTKHLIGEPVQEDLSGKFDGVWDLGDENIGYVKYAGKGQLHISGAEWKQDHFTFSEMTAVLTKCGDNKFVNFHDEESVSDQDANYLFGYCTSVEDVYFMVWLPKIEIFEEAVLKGLLKGEVIQGKNTKTVSLADSSQNICLFLKKHKLTDLFELEDPMIFRRIQKIKMQDEAPVTPAGPGTPDCAKPPCP